MCLLVLGLREDLIVEVISHVSQEESPVPVVSHMTPIVDAGHQVAQGFPRRLLVQVQVQAQQVLRHLNQSINDH